MQVFKLCLKILKKNIPSLSIYIVVFLGVAILMASFSTGEQHNNLFSQSKTNLAFICEEDTPLIQGLKEELTKSANFIELPDETEALQDALYFRTVSYILRIPAGFSRSFMNGEDVQLEKTVVPNSFSNIYLDLSIDQYFNSARLYVEQMDNLSQESLVHHLKSDLSADTAVELKTNGDEPANHLFAHYFFNYLSYSLMAILILGMSALMLVFHDQDLQRRNNCSPLSAASFNRQFVLAVLVFTGLVWLIMVTLCLLFNLNNILNINTIYFVINSLVFAICAASISYLIGHLVNNANTIPAISNVVTMGLCFISGVFVPIELLGSTVQKIAAFTPTYWFVAANNRIATITQFNYTNLQPVFTSMLIQLGFALAFFAIALVLGKKRRLG